MEIKNQNPRIRFHYLDSLRGIAAMMVVFYHFIGWKWHETINYKIAAFVFNGSDAVSFFFVLSGFVLSYPYLHLGRAYSVLDYVRSRILRLYPAYIFTILITALYHYRNSLSMQTLKEVFLYNKEPRIWNEMAMVLHNHDFYFPGWTLRIEMIYSLIVPILVFVVLRKYALLAVILIGSYFIGDPNTRLYMTHFVFGVLLAYYYPRLSSLKFSETKLFRYRFLLYVVIFVLFSFRNLKHFVPFVQNSFDFLWTYHIRWEHFSAVATSMILIFVIMSKPAQRFLETKILLFLGRISYSIYLIHWVLVILVMDHWDLWGEYLGQGYLRFYLMLAAVVSLTILFAHLMYRYIEQPFIKLSRKFRKH